MSEVASLLPVIRSQMSGIRIPSAHSKVYKDECVYSFDSPFSSTGLYLNLLTMHGVGERYLDLDANRTGCKLYLFQKWTKIVISEEGHGPQVPSKLAIGIEGGFNMGEKSETIKEHFLCVLNDGEKKYIPLPCQDLPEYLSNILQACIDHEGMRVNMQANTWDGDEVKIISKYADGLEQVNPAGRRIPQDPKQWKDEASDATDNLWLNLSTGYIGGGRKNWDGTGGSGSALQHFIDTGKKYPLVVKLGTITPHGADVYSYADDENCMVIDPKLSDHLSFWGIDIMKLEKTSKTVSEMEVSLNMQYDWSKIMEGQEKLEKLSGPGYLGLQNIGSSCYMNSALQVLLNIPEFQQRYYHGHEALVNTVKDPPEDLPLQLSKLSVALLSDRYVPPVDQTSGQLDSQAMQTESVDSSIPEQYVLAPRMFKQLIGRGHSEFSTGKQQDVSEFILYFLDQLQRSERSQLQRVTSSTVPTSAVFEFHVESKVKLLDSQEVIMGKHGPQTLCNSLDLPIPLNLLVKAEEKEDFENKRARTEGEGGKVPFEACVGAWLSPETVTMRHPRSGQTVQAVKTVRFATFPRYLMVKMGRYYVGENWVPKKITAEVPVPELLDLTSLLGQGVEGGEVLLDDSAPPSEELVADEELVANLVSMGFAYNGCVRAALATKNADIETAMNWVLEHMEDPDFDQPVVAKKESEGAGGKVQVNEEAIAMLSSMGYTNDQCTAALISCDQDIERAADWLFSHGENLDILVAEILGNNKMDVDTNSAKPSGSNSLEESKDGRYRLFAVISHIGKNTDHGHYLCHILKDKHWVLYNDDKVGKAEKPPLGHGFIYFYRREEAPDTI